MYINSKFGWRLPGGRPNGDRQSNFATELYIFSTVLMLVENVYVRSNINFREVCKVRRF